MNTTMTDGAEQRLDAQIAEALFGQPGMRKMDVANLVRELRGDGPALLGPRAQAVDLGQFRDSVVQAISNVSYMTGYGPAYEKLTELLALIDGKAVGK